MEFGYALSSEEHTPSDLIRSDERAGYTHMYFHQIGPDQDDFPGFAKSELFPRF
jgi:hypothetical protein